jgi:hypothetical protein
MIIHIKNMVSERCKRAVENILDKLAIQSSRIDLGEVVIDSKTSNLKLKAVKAELEMAGFEILIDKKIVPFSPATLWRKCKKREFPQPIKISAQITAWKVKDIRAWAKNPQSYKCDGGNQ